MGRSDLMFLWQCVGVICVLAVVFIAAVCVLFNVRD